MAFNRNKLGITLDTRHPAAADLLERLIRASDVLVENYRPGTLESMGLGSGHLHELNPGLIVTSLSGFGQTGPLSARALFDPIAQAMSGLMALTGDPDGPPTLTGTYIADHLAGLYGAIGTLLALYARRANRGGPGRRRRLARRGVLVPREPAAGGGDAGPRPRAPRDHETRSRAPPTSSGRRTGTCTSTAGPTRCSRGCAP